MELRLVSFYKLFNRQAKAVGLIISDELNAMGLLLGPRGLEADQLNLILENYLFDNQEEYSRLEQAMENNLNMMEPLTIGEYFFWFNINCVGNGYQRGYLATLRKMGKKSPIFKFYLLICQERLRQLQNGLARLTSTE
jgi:hypothetical protein